MVRQVNLEQAKAIVDRPIKPQLPDQQMHCIDAAGVDCPSPLGDLVVNVRSGKFRPLRGRAINAFQPPGDSSLGVFSAAVVP